MRVVVCLQPPAIAGALARRAGAERKGEAQRLPSISAASSRARCSTQAAANVGTSRTVSRASDGFLGRSHRKQRLGNHQRSAGDFSGGDLTEGDEDEDVVEDEEEDDDSGPFYRKAEMPSGFGLLVWRLKWLVWYFVSCCLFVPLLVTFVVFQRAGGINSIDWKKYKMDWDQLDMRPPWMWLWPAGYPRPRPKLVN